MDCLETIVDTPGVLSLLSGSQIVTEDDEQWGLNRTCIQGCFSCRTEARYTTDTDRGQHNRQCMRCKNSCNKEF